MKKVVYILILIAVILAGWMIWSNYKTSTATSGATPIVGSLYFGEKISPVLGKYLTDNAGMTLYFFRKDTANMSNCSGACIVNWPPYGPGVGANGVANLPALPKNISTMKRSDGTLQFTWKGLPLYHYVADMVVGDVKGQGVINSWYVINI